MNMAGASPHRPSALLNDSDAASIAVLRQQPANLNVRGADVVLRRRLKAEALKAEAEARLRVKPSAIRRERDPASGKLVTHVDPFESLEAHEQQTFERREAHAARVREAEGPFAPVTATQHYNKAVMAVSRSKIV